MTQSEYVRRVERLRAVLAREGLCALAVFDPKNVRYLSGFTGEDACLLVSLEEVTLLSDFRFRVQASQESPQIRFVETEESLARALPSLLTGLSGAVGVESTFLPASDWLVLQEGVRPHSSDTRPTKGLVEELRRVKSLSEQDLCRQAGTLVAATMEQLLRMKVVGRPEAEVALELEVWARRQGSGPAPFPYIVAAGPRGAMPHGTASRATIPADALLVVDIGVSVDGYTSDMTRTFSTGALSELEKRIFRVVLEAQELGLRAVRPGQPCAAVDSVSREHIERSGFGLCFRHGLGHGVGLDVHEAPRLGPRSEDVLEEGMVLTVEPGVYVEGTGGVRIEDTVLVSATGAQVLTEFPRELLRLH